MQMYRMVVMAVDLEEPYPFQTRALSSRLSLLSEAAYDLVEELIITYL